MSESGCQHPSWHAGENMAQLRDNPLSFAPAFTGTCKELGLPFLSPDLHRATTGAQPKRCYKDLLEHWLRQQKQVSEKVFCSWKLHLSSGSCGWVGIPLVLTRTLSTGGQAQLCFAVAR